MSFRSKILLLLQFLCFGYFAFFSKVFASSGLLLVQLLGIALGIWSVISMGLRNFNAQPEVRKGARLIRTGPYALIRNPMYTSLLLFFTPGLLNEFNWTGFAVLMLLGIVFALKIRDEEKFLLGRFGAIYASYRESTYRLIPYVY